MHLDSRADEEADVESSIGGILVGDMSPSEATSDARRSVRLSRWWYSSSILSFSRPFFTRLRCYGRSSPLLQQLRSLDADSRRCSPSSWSAEDLQCRSRKVSWLDVCCEVDRRIKTACPTRFVGNCGCLASREEGESRRPGLGAKSSLL